MEELLKNRGFERMCSAGFAAELLSEISRIKNGIFFFREGLRNSAGKPAASLKWLHCLHEWAGALRFQMTWSCKVLFYYRRNAAYREKWQHRIRYLLVDEFQDVNLTQYELIKLLAGKEKNIFVVGDDDQSIYGFRGSVPGIMKRFSQVIRKKRYYFWQITTGVVKGSSILQQKL